MRQLAACMKKEWLELRRTVKLLFYILVPFALILLSLLMMFAMEFAANSGINVDGDIGTMFGGTAGAEINFFLTFLMTYFMIFVIVMQMGSSSREIKKRMWLIPMTSGIKRQNIVLAKIIVLCLVAIIPSAVALFVNNLLAVVIYENTGAAALTAVQMFKIGVCAIVTVAIFSLMTITLSAITKNAGVTVAITLSVMLLGTIILSQFGFVNYTPLMFYNLALSGGHLSISGAEWAVSISTTVVMLVLLIYFALYPLRRKPKPAQPAIDPFAQN